MKILVACEFSGRIRDAMISRGHDAVSCDLEPTEAPGPHIQDDVRKHLAGWDMIIAHPPCQYLANSGVRWRVERNQWSEVRQAANFFCLFLDAPCDLIAIENPVMHKYAGIRKPDFTIQPWQFGDNYKKRTCFWTKNLPKLKPTSELDGKSAVAEVHRMPPSENRAKLRSKTYPGIANAIAAQWGNLK